MERGWVVVLVLSCLGLARRTAEAAPPPEPSGQLAEAERHKDAGYALIVEGAFEKGIRELESAFEIVPYPNYVFGIAVSYERWGLPSHCAQALEAWTRFFAACDACQQEQAAKKRRAQVEERCRSELTIRTAPAGALIVIDDRPRGLAPVTATVAPGRHLIRAALKGRRAHESEILSEAGKASVVELTLELSINVPERAPPKPDPLAGLKPEARAEYERSFLRVGEVTKKSDGSVTFRRPYDIYRGKYGKKIDEGEFYEIVGREDLAKEHAERKTAFYGLIIGGAVVGAAGIIGGFAYALSSAGCNRGPSDPLFRHDCIEQPSSNVGTGVLIMILGAAVGGGMVGGAFVIKRHVVGPDEMQALGEQYNERLRRDLSGPTPKLRPDGATAPEQKESSFLEHLQLSPYAAVQGGGLVLSGAF